MSQQNGKPLLYCSDMPVVGALALLDNPVDNVAVTRTSYAA